MLNVTAVEVFPSSFQEGTLAIDGAVVVGLSKHGPDFLWVLQMEINYTRTININRPRLFLLHSALLYELKVTKENL